MAPKASRPKPPDVPLVSSLEEARAAVLAFGPAAAGSEGLRARFAYHRAWVAVKEDGWRYAPARWAGHKGLDADTYLSLGEALDGRRSDAALAAWFAPVGDPKRHDKHMRRLRELFAQAGAGRAPNARTRVLEVAVEPGGGRDGEKTIVDLMEAVFRSLSTPAQASLRKRIG